MDEDKYGFSAMPSAATFFVVTIFNLSGFLNVVLVFTTKPNLGLFGPALNWPVFIGGISLSKIRLRLTH
jgi:hypothetical protein